MAFNLINLMVSEKTRVYGPTDAHTTEIVLLTQSARVDVVLFITRGNT